MLAQATFATLAGRALGEPVCVCLNTCPNKPNYVSDGLCDDGDEPDEGGGLCGSYGTDCDDPSRRMRRSIKSFEDELGVRAPERLHSCASEPGDGLFTQSGSCGVGSMLEASEWLANATSAWRERKERAA